MYICDWGSCTMYLLFFHYIWQSCSEVVATLVIHVINQIMNGWRLTQSVLYFIQFATLIYNYIEYQSFKCWCKFVIWQLFVFQKNHINQIKPVEEHYDAWSVVNIPLILLLFYDLQHMYTCMYNICWLRRIYAKYSNSTTN